MVNLNAVETQYLSQLPDEWFERICVFNWQPVSWVHPDRLTGMLRLEAKDVVALLAVPRSQRRLSQALLQRLSLQRQHCLDFRRLEHKLALLDYQILQQAALISGLVLHFYSITHSILKSTVGKMIGIVGEQGFRQVLALRKDYAAVVQNSVYSDPDALEKIVVLDGWRCVATWMRRLPDSLKLRVLLRLPVLSEEQLQPLKEPVYHDLLIDAIRPHLPSWIDESLPDLGMNNGNA